MRLREDVGDSEEMWASYRHVCEGSLWGRCGRRVGIVNGSEEGVGGIERCGDYVEETAPLTEGARRLNGAVHE